MDSNEAGWKIGDKFRVKSLAEINKTLNENEESNLSGVFWDEEMEDGCNKILEVCIICTLSVGARITNWLYNWSNDWIEKVNDYTWGRYEGIVKECKQKTNEEPKATRIRDMVRPSFMVIDDFEEENMLGERPVEIPIP